MLVIVAQIMDHMTIATIKRQIPFLIGGTITGIVMSYYLGFLLTIFVNSIVWYLISLFVYRVVWRKNGLTDQKILLRFFDQDKMAKAHTNRVENEAYSILNANIQIIK